MGLHFQDFGLVEIGHFQLTEGISQGLFLFLVEVARGLVFEKLQEVDIPFRQLQVFSSCRRNVCSA